MTNCKHLILFILFAFSWCLAIGQSGFEVFEVECHEVGELLVKQEQILDEYKINFKKYKHKKKFLKEVEKRQARYLEQVDNEEYYCDARLENVVDKILNQLINENKELNPQAINIKVGRYPWANASFIGDHTIIINLGLLLQLKSEDELAFVLSHELAHLHLDHLDNDMIASLNYLNSKKTKEKIKKIKKSKYKKYSQAKRLLKRYVYDHRKHSRNHEIEADSLGFLFFKKAGFISSGAISALAILDSVDSIVEIDLKLDSIFNFEKFPFQEKWIKEKKTMFGGKSQKNTDWDADSLKTHPQCKERIKILESKVSSNEESEKLLFYDLKLQLQIEEIRSLLHFGHLDYALIKAIGLYNIEASHDHGAKYVFEILNTYYNLRLNHNAWEFVGKVNKSRTKNQKHIRLFLKNIRTKHLAILRYYFIDDKIQSRDSMNNEFNNYQRVIAAYDADLPNKSNLKKKFQIKYPTSQLKIK